MSTYAKVVFDRDGPLATIKLNDPAHMNAVDEEMRTELVDAMSRALDDDGVRAILVTGEGRAFCAGANLKDMSRDQTRGQKPTVGHMLRDGINAMLVRMVEGNKPVVTAINGPAVGFGCGLALAGDFVLVGRSAYFFQSFIRRGVVPDGGSSWLIPRLVGAGRARAMMMLGEKIDAEQALAWGLAHRLYNDAELFPAARAFAVDLANGPTLAYAQIKKMIAASTDNSFAEQLELEAVCQEAAFDTDDCREGIAAFIAGRPPSFKGQ